MSDPADTRPWQPPNLSGRALKREEPAGPDPDALRREAFEAGYAEGLAAGRARGGPRVPPPAFPRVAVLESVLLTMIAS